MSDYQTDKDTLLTVTLPTFDGPFDLLLSLIRRNEWPIYDLPVAQITRQFLDYVRSAEQLDMELGIEFMETASWLVLLQSRSLLPIESAPAPDPREELVRAVLDHEALTRATEVLRSQYNGEITPTSAGADAARPSRDLLDPPREHVTLEQILAAAMEAVAAARAAASFEGASQDAAKVDDLMQWVLASLPRDAAVATDEWFEAQPSLAHRVALFLALLELTKAGRTLLYQARPLTTLHCKALGGGDDREVR